MRYILTTLLIIFICSSSLMAQTFTEIDPDIVGVQNCDAAWGDYDRDGDLDILLCGTTGIALFTPTTRIYRNDGNDSFINIDADLTDVEVGSVDWMDYDQNDTLDILITGLSGLSITSKIYSGLTETDIELPPVQYGDSFWGDYDNDGDLDIFVTGVGDSLSLVANIYRNDGHNNFTNINALFLPVLNSSADWGDYDGDGDLDVVITGWNLLNQNNLSQIYQNVMGVYVPMFTIFLEHVQFGITAWGDYDGDGDLDLFLAGQDTTSEYISKIYRNDGNNFSDIDADLTGVISGTASWGDCDNDGDLDLVVTGNDGLLTGISTIYLNEGDDTFIELDADLPNLRNSTAIWGDYDNDGDLDLLLAGYLNLFNRITRIYRNDGASPNELPDPPTNLIAEVDEDNVDFSWQPGNDPETPASALTYNLRIGTTSGGHDILSGMADSETGWRRVVHVGNRHHETSFDLQNLSTGTYYWSVQTIDQTLAGSAFAIEDSFMIEVSNAYPFVEINGDWVDAGNSAVQWGDYDGDGDLDMLITGTNNAGDPITHIYRNDGVDNFNPIDVDLPAVEESAVAWGDYDNDNDLDLVITGQSASGRLAAIYRNDGNDTFTNIDADLQPVNQGAVAWGDYDNDGDLDLVLTGLTQTGGWLDPYEFTAKLYRNDGNDTFIDTPTNLQAVYQSDVAWADYDNDGDLDLLLSGNINDGIIPPYDSITKIYQNDAGILTETNIDLIDANGSSVDWGDYDNDGDLDILLTGGNSLTVGQAKIYRNDGNQTFTDINADLTGVSSSSARWGDYDNDGWLDLLLTGSNTVLIPTTKIYHNNQDDTFLEMDGDLTNVLAGSVDWGDYDNDGDLDILLTGYAGTTPATKLYRNDGSLLNTLPSSPAGLLADTDGDEVILSWQSAVDEETPAPGLTYNLRIGLVNGGTDVMTAMANPDGYRQVMRIGNTNQNTTWRIENLAEGTYYWSVQAIDAAYAGSSFSDEGSFVIEFTDIPTETKSPRVVNHYQLHQNYPNPFNPVTTITYDLPVTSFVDLSVYDLQGRLIKTLVSGDQVSGRYSVEWFGVDGFGRLVSSGIYFYRLRSSGQSAQTKQMILLR